VPILVLANKKDLRDAMTASELTTALALTDVKVLRHHEGRTHICLCTALTAAALSL
jgi:signal recognition particle receptor subunit beta